MALETEDLKALLEEKHNQYNRPAFIADDPIAVPHLFSKAEDIEIAGFLTATIAWGQRPTILANARQLMDRMDRQPHDFILNFTESDLEPFASFVHRTFNGQDCTYFLHALQNIYRNHGGLQAAFTTGKGGIYGCITAFRQLFFELPHPARVQKHVSNPHKGASAKRLNMFLRWMCRKDKRGVDFGLWDIPMSELHLPLDVHTGNVARKLGLLARKQNDWKAVEEVTANLKKLDAEDPIKYDFALFGLGVFEKF